ncbi:ABC transporter substrate-binding protein [Acidithiobacillus caldus]|uniref:Fe(III) ABC transporter, periplasmic-binding protein AfuA n=2 Tax=Acidithiobacillus caldus TaxID=33059 RepID=B7SUZ8_9PROT|nr:extracellular solute-binding protein [Acidithiobacillus caldus]ACI62960.1 Fe(III) ABC transporter, periplasmic-binding protein AfuA [Acidithiobacillus caldus]AIA54989.1 ABC-type Fe3+ transport system periplasmic component-like protein [Acidithiobacillus caldus ATCC 51756]MBU2731008.1 extracellular solute-binding protein [Acidithiobacillus caldus]MBU2735994.1 extracellular solute-binding protein [Acidithiobacillus caldus ATCC 51756]MBU2745595.1 extracellular solute-binding protein [Acidithio
MRKLIWILIPLLIVVAVWSFWPRQKPGLVFYSAVSYGPMLAQAFTKESGIPVRVVEMSTGALLARVSAQGNNPQWDVAWFDGASAAAGLQRAHLVASGIVPRDIPWTDLGKSLIPADGAWIPTGYTLAGVFLHPAKRPAPATWDDLLQARWRGRFAMNNPAISGPTYPQVAGWLYSHGGWPAGQSFLLALKANGMQVYPKNSNTIHALSQGEVDLAIVQSSAAYALAAEQPGRWAVSIPKSAVLLPRVMVFADHLSAKQRRDAADFARFMLSPKAQELAMRKGAPDGYYWPITRTAPTADPGMASTQSLPLINLDPAFWGARESAINAWFSSHILGQ